MADATKCQLSEEGAKAKEYVSESSRRLQEGVDDTLLAQEA